MKLPSISLNLDWWQKEFRDRPYDHIGPACVLAVSTVIIAAIGNKHFAAGFMCLAVISYPYAHHQIEYLMYLDVHETAYGVAIVGIQVFCMKAPLLSPWGLPMSVALAYSFTVRGMRLRQLLSRQQEEMRNFEKLNKTLKEQMDALQVNTKKLEEALEKLAKEILKKEELTQRENKAEATKEEVVLEMETDYSALNKQLLDLTEICNKFIQGEGLDEQLQKISKNNFLIESKNKELQKIIDNYNVANKKFDDLIARAEKNEIAVQEGLKSFHQWLITLST